MQQLSGLDAMFLHLETGAQFGHTASLSTFKRPDATDYEPYAAWRQQLEQRLHLLEPLRRRLVELPLGLDHPYWIEDPDFDLDYHVRHSAVPPPGRDDQLAEVVSRIVARPLDRRRPLWLSYVIEGLADERFGVLTVIHHATIDGASGMELMTLMLDADPGGGTVPAPDRAWRPEPIPGDLRLLGLGALGLARKPARAVLLTARTAAEIGRATRNPALVGAANRVQRGLRGRAGSVLNVGRRRSEDRDPPPSLPTIRAPRSPFNRPITPHRGFAIGSASLDAVKAIKNALAVSVNDVVLAVCAGGLRSWLELREALPGSPLVAVIPVSIRTGEEADRWTNRVSVLTAPLPTDEPDPVARVARVHEVMSGRKELFKAIPAERLTDFAQFPPPAIFARAMRLSARLRLGSRLGPSNVAISNVPGPRQPLYAAGAELEHYYPVSTIFEGQALNITVVSYRDRLDFGLVCCPEIVPDLDYMLQAILEEIRGLAALVGHKAAQSRTSRGRRPAAQPGVSAGGA
jgi:WS/DGAT/MGAT family acyltransferase